MDQTLLAQLRAMTAIVVDSDDLKALQRFNSQDSTANPSSIAAAAELPQYAWLIDGVLRIARAESRSCAKNPEVAKLAFRHLAVGFGKLMLKSIPGRVSTAIDARLSFDREAILTQARDVIRQYELSLVPRERVLVQIVATWDGIQAAKLLESENIRCNLTLVFGMHQAVACADANVTLISPFVSRILDWYKNRTGFEYLGPADPGVQSVTAIYNYMRKFNHRTLVMGASFRNITEIRLLAGCDLLAISPKLLAELDSTTGDLHRALSPERAAATQMNRMRMDQNTFERMHRLDAMASEQLASAIKEFGSALEQLESLLVERLSNSRETFKP